MATRHPHFVVVIDADSFGVMGHPAPRRLGDVSVSFTGYLHGRDCAPAADDARVVADAYRASGSALSATLLGGYAAVIADPAHRQVVVTQDSLGLQPVFYRRTGTSIEVSTRLEWLVARSPGAAIDEPYFAEYLVSAQYPRERTPYRGIRRLSLGHVLTIGRDGERRQRPWTPRSQRRVPHWADAAAELRRLVTDAVEGQLPVRGNVDCELSGGLDSSTVYAIASRKRPDVAALTVVDSAAPVADDDAAARAIVDTVGGQWHRLDVAEWPPYATTPDGYSPEPGTEIDYGIRQAYLRLLAEHAVDTVLSGLGGDIIFGGPGSRPLFLADAVATGHPLRAWRLARAWSHDSRPRRHWTHPLLHTGLGAVCTHWSGRRISLAGNMSPPDWLTAGLVGCLDGSWRRQPSPRLARPSQQLIWELVYETAIALGAARHPHLDVEMRHPLLHRPLVEYMAALDTAFTFSPEGNRLLQRHALAGQLPEVVRLRRSKGNPQRGYDIALGNSGRWLSALTHDSRLVSRGWVRPDRWQAELARARLGVIPNRPQLEASMMAEWWLRSIEIHSPRPAPSLAVPVPPTVD